MCQQQPYFPFLVFMSWKIGQEILKKLNESSLSRKEFAEKISKSRSNLYPIFNKTHINTDELMLISKALGYNFFAYYYEELKDLPPSNEEVVSAKSFQECQQKVADLEARIKVLERENDLLKKINQLLEGE